MRGIVDTARNGAVLKTLSDNNQARLRITSLVLGGLGGCLCLTACSQAIDYTYSKRDFTTPRFEADLAACRHQNASASAFKRRHQTNVRNSTKPQCEIAWRPRGIRSTLHPGEDPVAL
jgi:hypothetical protein